MGWTYAKGLECHWIFIPSYSESFSLSSYSCITASCSLPLSLFSCMCASVTALPTVAESVYMCEYLKELSDLCRHSKGVCEHFIQTKSACLIGIFGYTLRSEVKHRAQVSSTELWTLKSCFTDISYPLPTSASISLKNC